MTLLLNIGKSYLSLIGLFLISSLTGVAIKAQAPDTARIKIEIGLTGNIQTGNFERLQFINQLNASFDTKTRNWNIHTRHLYLYQSVFGNQSQDDYLTRNFLTYRINQQWDVFGAFFLEKYLIKRIDLHTQFGIGTRWAVIKKPRSLIQIGLMASYSNKVYVAANFEDFDNKGADTIEAFMISPILNSRLVLVPERLFFNLLFWYQQDVAEIQNWRFNLETALLMPVYKGLNLKVSFNNFYENINLVGVQANDTFLTYGVSYRF